MKVSEDIKFFSLVSYMDFLKIERDISNNQNDWKAIAFILSDRFIEESIAVEDKHKILQWLCSLETISIVVIDCNISDQSFEYLLCFDLCLATTQVAISLQTLSRAEYFSSHQMRLLLSNRYDLYPHEAGDANELIQSILVNQRIDSFNIESCVNEFAASVLEGKTHDYIRFLKRYFNLYKKNKDIDRSLLQSEETISFCELALKKYKNG